MALSAGAALAGTVAGVSAAGAASAPPCAPRVTTTDGHRSIAYCGPATVTIELAGRTYRFHNGLCDRSATIGALELNVGTIVRGARGNAGHSFVSLVIARSPSESEAFEADAGGRQLFGDTVISLGGNPLGSGTFTGILGAAFTGSWSCHGVVYSGP